MRKILTIVIGTLAVCASLHAAEPRTRFELQQEYLKASKALKEEKKRHQSLLLEVTKYEVVNSNILARIRFDSERVLSYATEAKKAAIVALYDASDVRDDLTNQVSILETKVAGQTNRIATLEAKRVDMTNRLAAARIQSHSLSNQLTAVKAELEPLQNESATVKADSEFIEFVERVRKNHKTWLRTLMFEPVPGISAPKR